MHIQPCDFGGLVQSVADAQMNSGILRDTDERSRNLRCTTHFREGVGVQVSAIFIFRIPTGGSKLELQFKNSVFENTSGRAIVIRGGNGQRILIGGLRSLSE